MKKNTLSITFLIFVCSLSAQTTVTKSIIIGNWQVESIEAANSFYYHFAKDSFFMPEKPPAASPQIEVNRLIAQAELKKGIKNAFIKDGKRVLMIFTKNDSLLTGYKDTTGNGYSLAAEGSGTYKFNESNGLLTMEYKSDLVQQVNLLPQCKVYFTKQGSLVMEMEQNGILMKMELSKVE